MLLLFQICCVFSHSPFYFLFPYFSSNSLPSELCFFPSFLFQLISGDIQNAKHDNIWQLFREAQQSQFFPLSHIYGFVEEWLVISGVFFLLLPDILYLNKQRLVAIEELNKTNGEKQLLLNKIKKLEAEKQAGAGKGDRSWHVLLYFIQHIR